MIKKTLFLVIIYVLLSSQAQKNQEEKDVLTQTGETEVTTQTISSKVEKINKITKIMIPPGSFVRATVLVGGSFPLEGGTQTYPIVLIATSNIILPNYNQAQIDYALLTGVAVGEYVESRVRITITGISYFLQDKMYYTTCRGFVVD